MLAVISTWNLKQPVLGCFSWMISNLYMEKWLFHQTSIANWLFGVPGNTVINNWWLPLWAPSKWTKGMIFPDWTLKTSQLLQTVAISSWSVLTMAGAGWHRDLSMSRWSKVLIATSALAGSPPSLFTQPIWTDPKRTFKKHYSWSHPKESTFIAGTCIRWVYKRQSVSIPSV